MKLSNKFYTFEEKMKKNFIVKNKLNENELNKNEKMLLKYEKLNNEKTELFDAILSTGTSNTILAPMKQNRRITHIIIAFTQNSQNPFKSTPTDFSSGFIINADAETNITTYGMSLINNVSITIGGVTYPQAVYNLSSSVSSAIPFVVTTALASNTNDQAKAYNDFLAFSDAIRDRSGSLLSFSQWQANQIYAFKLTLV